MEKQIMFQTFLHSLRAVGVQVTEADFTESPEDAWRAIPANVRQVLLQVLGFTTVNPDEVTLSLTGDAATPGGVLVVLRTVDAAPADAPPAPDADAMPADADAIPAEPPAWEPETAEEFPAPEAPAEPAEPVDAGAAAEEPASWPADPPEPAGADAWPEAEEPEPVDVDDQPEHDPYEETPATRARSVPPPDAPVWGDNAGPVPRGAGIRRLGRNEESEDVEAAAFADAPVGEPFPDPGEWDAADAVVDAEPGAPESADAFAGDPEDENPFLRNLDADAAPADEADPEDMGLGDAEATAPGVPEELDAWAAPNTAPDVDEDPEAAGDAADAAPGMPAEAEDADEPRKKGLLGFLRGRKKGASEEEEEAHAPDEPVDITVIPPLEEPHLEEVETYCVSEPYAYIRIIYDSEEHEYLYELVEPSLSEREKNVLDFIEDTLVDVIEVGATEVPADDAAVMLRRHVDEIIYDYSIVLAPLSKEKLLYYILRDFLGFGLLDPFMRDEMIEDISCDGPGVPIFLYHRKYESMKSRTMFRSHEELDSFVIRMAQRSGKHISIAEPLLDATLPDGSRLNATLSDEVTSNGSTFTIRKFKEDPFTPPDLVRFGTMSAEILAYWWLAVQNGASAIYAGGTASGKTTSLNAILLFIPPQMKIVSIEDTREVNLPHLNWIAGITRSGFGPRDNNGRQAGEIDMFTLLKAALRQRPEYILVGEVRGSEAYALFQAMATGHTAYGTMHADSVESVIHRLESDPISIPRSLLEALDIVSVQIQTRIGEKRVRRSKEIVEVVGLDPHTREILTNEVFNWDPSRDAFEYSGVSYVLERIMMERNLTETDMREELNRRREVIELLIALDFRDYRDVAKVIVSYYKEPEKTLDDLRERKVNQDLAEQEAAAVAAARAREAEAADEEWPAPDADAAPAVDEAFEDVPLVVPQPIGDQEDTADVSYWRLLDEVGEHADSDPAFAAVERRALESAEQLGLPAHEDADAGPEALPPHHERPPGLAVPEEDDESAEAGDEEDEDAVIAPTDTGAETAPTPDDADADDEEEG